MSLFSFDPFDSHFFFQKEKTSQNLLGYFGSMIAFLSVYYLGFLSLFLPVICFCWFLSLGILKKIFLILGELFLILLLVCLVEAFKPIFTYSGVVFKTGGYFGEDITHYFFKNNLKYFLSFGSIAVFLLMVSFYSNFFAKTLKKYLRFFYIKNSFFKIYRFFKSFRKKFLKRNTNKFLKNRNIFLENDFSSVFEKKSYTVDQKDQEVISKKIIHILEHFKIKGQILGYCTGPRLTTYFFQPLLGTKSSLVYQMSKDLALSLNVDGVFFENHREKNAIGIQLPNVDQKPIYLGNILDSSDPDYVRNALRIPLGLCPLGSKGFLNLREAPHVLVAGATGAGKSMFLNTTICSLLASNDRDFLQLVLVDPKHLEFSAYENSSYLKYPIITESKEALEIFHKLVEEMEDRYKIFKKYKVKDLKEYLATSKSSGSKKPNIPYIVVIVDEYGDLMLSTSKKIEEPLLRLAQKSRACGIHLILATQRPSVDTVTGTIKANFPTRISFRVTNRYDSKVILDHSGAEELLGNGDMLLLKPGLFNLKRYQAPFVSGKEIEKFLALLEKPLS